MRIVLADASGVFQIYIYNECVCVFIHKINKYIYPYIYIRNFYSKNSFKILTCWLR